MEYLLKLGTDRVFPHTEMLAARIDMALCDRDGKRLDVPASEGRTNAQTDRIAELEAQLDSALGDNGAVVMQALKDENESLTAEVDALKTQVANLMVEINPPVVEAEEESLIDRVEHRINACVMDKNKLADMAKELLGLDLDKRATWERLVEKVREATKESLTRFDGIAASG